MNLDIVILNKNNLIYGFSKLYFYFNYFYPNITFSDFSLLKLISLQPNNLRNPNLF